MEVMVACGVFALLMVSTIFFYDLSQRSNRKADVHSEAYREAALALRHVRRELKGIRLTRVGSNERREGPQVGENGAILQYLSPQWQDSQIVVDHRGNPVWAREQQLRVTTDGKLMVAERPTGSELDVPFDDTRQLADLGTGEMRFELLNDQLLKITVSVERVGTFGSADQKDRSKQDLSLTIGLANQQFWKDLEILKKF